jgi:cysteine desulfurase
MSRLKTFYFDYAATTPLDEKVLSAMLPYLKNEFGNPSNLYELGRNASRAIIKATEIISDILGCRSDEFVYTGSATEADNLAILGTARANRQASNLSTKLGAGRIIVSQIEHKGILAVCDVLKKEGFDVVELPIGKDGLVNIFDLEKALTPQTILVSITSADSETGTIQPIDKISKIIENYRNKLRNKKSPPQPLPKGEGLWGGVSSSSLPYFHTDASQSAGYTDINVDKLGVDLMTLSAHKLYGPKGIGGLYVRRGVKINPIIYGGGQEAGLRSGTENVPAIVGFAKALSLNNKNKKIECLRIKKMRDVLEKGIFKSIPKVVLNGHQQKRLPNFLNISILDVEGEAMLLHLNEIGIMVATGSACNSQSLEPSYVLTALGNPYEYVHGSIRFTLGKENTMADVKYVLKHLPEVVKKLRDISPLELKLDQMELMSNPKAFIGNQTPHFLRKNPPLPKASADKEKYDKKN